MAKIFTLQDLKVVIEPHALLIKPFSDIWKADKSKDKSTAYNKIQYIWFYTDYDSPYFQLPESEREIKIKEQVLQDKDYKITEDIKEGIKAYNKMYTTPAMEMLETAVEVVNKMKNYFKSVDFTEKDNNGKLVYDAKEIVDTVAKLPKLTESLNQAKELCKKEQSVADRVRGNASVGMFED